MLESFFVGIIPDILKCVGRLFMKVFSNWWRNKWLRHIERTITHERIRIKAEDIGQVPQLSIIWVINNRSMADIKISEISGSVFVEAWQVARFGAVMPSIKQAGYDRIPSVTVQCRDLKREIGSSEVNITLFPPIEFWLGDSAFCALFDVNIEFYTFWGKVRTPLPNEHIYRIPIDDIKGVRDKYIGRLQNRLRQILT